MGPPLGERNSGPIPSTRRISSDDDGTSSAFLPVGFDIKAACSLIHSDNRNNNHNGHFFMDSQNVGSSSNCRYLYGIFMYSRRLASVSIGRGKGKKPWPRISDRQSFCCMLFLSDVSIRNWENFVSLDIYAAYSRNYVPG